MKWQMWARRPEGRVRVRGARSVCRGLEGRRPAHAWGGAAGSSRLMVSKVYFVLRCVREFSRVIIIKFNRPCQEGPIIMLAVQ